MSKIGIMTMHRIHNYGSFLQAYGLKRIIEELGFDVEFVDYNYETTIINEKKNLIDYINKISKNINILDYFQKKRFIKRFNTTYDNEYLPLLCNNKYNYNCNSIDELVIGSDEVFNCLQGYPVGYSRELFGKNYESIPVISYAACFGQTNYDRLKQYNISDEVSELLGKFKNISVRDNNSYDTVYELTGIKSNINLDPVLIYDFVNDTIDKVTLKDYIIVYAYSGRLSKKEMKIIKRFARKNNKKIVSIGMYQKIADYNIIVHPFELFSYFKHADFVITDTFHGSIFSIKNHANFCTIIRNSNNGNSNKLVDLLNRLNLNDRIITSLNDLNNYYNNKIDYSMTDKIIKEEHDKSIKYLNDSLKESD